MLSSLIFFSLAISQASAFYANTDVIEMDATQFKSQVLKGDELWLVEFYGERMCIICIFVKRVAAFLTTRVVYSY